MSSDIAKFKQEIQNEISDFDDKQTVKFAWLCAVRALPFICLDSSFINLEKHYQVDFYSILFGFDICIARYYINAKYTTLSDVVNTAADCYQTDSDTLVNYIDVVTSINSNSYACNSSSFDLIADVTMFALTTALCVSNLPPSPILSAAYSATVLSVIISVTVRYFNKYNFPTLSVKKLEEIIMQDIEDIRHNRQIQNNSTELYGAIWDNFQKALNNEGCEYWGKLYQRIFENHFEVDKDELEKRLNVPNEIRELGAAEVANYLQAIEDEGKHHLNEARLIILGDKGAGKTSITTKLLDPEKDLPAVIQSTPGVDKHIWNLEDDDMKIHIWDFAGHTVTHAVHKFFLSERCLYIIVFNGRPSDMNPTENLRYWLDHIKTYGGKSKVLILINKYDTHRVDIEINNLIEEYDFLIGKEHYFSIKDDIDKIRDFRELVIESIKGSPSWKNSEIPSNHFWVKEDLESLFIKGDSEHAQELISIDDMRKIAESRHIENFESLCTMLNALGICLWYKDMEKYKTLILNPEWISYGVYKIINWLYDKKQHKIRLKKFGDVFSENPDRYPKEKHELLFDLMINYELAYEVENCKQLVIPHLLKKDKPEELPDFPVGESLMSKFTANHILPPNTISRFIVKHNESITNKTVWRYGVLLSDGNGTIALIRENVKERVVSIAVKGKNKISYHAELIKSLSELFDTYKTDTPEFSVSVKEYGLITDDGPFLSAENLIGAIRHGYPIHEPLSGQAYPVNKLFNDYSLENHRFPNNTYHFYAPVQSVGHDNTISYTTNIYQQQNKELQGQFNNLLLELVATGNIALLTEIKNNIDLLKTYENTNPAEIPVEEKKGFVNKLRKFMRDMGDKNSNIYKEVDGAKHIVSTINPLIESFTTGLAKAIYGK